LNATLFKGGSFSDERGNIRFVNEKIPGNYKRFYLITPANTSIVRAWQGHKFEKKAFYAISGSFLIAVVKPSHFEVPGEDEIPQFFELTKDNNALLHVPGGCYTGIKSKSPNSTLLVLSEFDLEGSKKDDFRQPPLKWVNWNSIS
jgi:dTDP-4-dehydrorhamnose 3,5-epimerase-like enzyme